MVALEEISRDKKFISLLESLVSACVSPVLVQVDPFNGPTLVRELRPREGGLIENWAFVR